MEVYVFVQMEISVTSAQVLDKEPPLLAKSGITERSFST